MHHPVPPQATPERTNSRRRAGRHRAARAEITARPGRVAALVAALAALVVGPVVGLLYSSSATAAPTTYTIWPSSTTPRVAADSDTQPVEVGVRFTAADSGWITGIRYYKSATNTGRHTGHLWDSSGRQLAGVTFSGETTSGWQQANLTTPVQVRAGGTYTASYYAPKGHYAGDVNALSPTRPKSTYALTATQGVYSYSGGMPRSTWQSSNYYVDVVFTTVRPSGAIPASTGTPSSTTSASPTSSATTTTAPSKPAPTTTTPAPTTTTPAPTTTAPTTTAPSTTAPTTTAPSATTTAPAPSTGFPDASNTGWTGTLSPYTGPCTIQTANYAIRNADVKAKCSALLVQTTGVTIDNSRLPRVESTYGDGKSSVSISNSNVEAGNWSDGAVWGYNITLSHSEVTGGQHSVHANDNVTVTDSWLHGQYNPAGQGYHTNAFITNGGSNMVVRHNTLHCDSILNSTDGGCTADVSLFGDFDPVTNVLVQNNLLKANDSSISYCAYGGYQPAKAYPVSTNIRYLDNVFERGTNGKCGVYGPVTSFQSSASGNAWSGNTYQDGTVINP